ncbi:MAG: N-acetyltransferase [Bacteroidetes bacterium]|jgi:predicted GNAT family acetyltransferase|nr:N-acetyltransferase [Bacteroidota bacterium]
MQVKDNKVKQRFEAEVDGYTAFIDYKIVKDVIDLIHTEVPKEIGGRGVAGEMTETVLMQIELLGYKVKPLCPYIKKYIERNPEWQEIVAE